MCGIVGYTGSKQASPILLDGLSRLEHRGYDSAGIAVLKPGDSIDIFKAEGKLHTLKKKVDGNEPIGEIGVGHTRWATHGTPTDKNAHPHTDCSGNVAVVHNGIVENYLELRASLENEGHKFLSQTDSECIPHLIEKYLLEGYALTDAVGKTAQLLRGANAVSVISRQQADNIVAFRLGNAGGIVLGYGEQEMFLSSDLPALLPYTRKIAYLSDGEMVSITPAGASYYLTDGTSVSKAPSIAPADTVTAAKGDYSHFMLKEIHEQPEAVISAMRGRISFDSNTVDGADFGLTDVQISKINRVVLLGMGTSLHAAMVGRLWIESFARIPAESDNSSEFRYRDPVIDQNTLVISITQSGETADTLSAMELAAEKGAYQVAITNYDGTQATRIADSTLLMKAGIEIGVAATKTFTCSLITLFLFAMHLGQKRGTLEREKAATLLKEVALLPELLGKTVVDTTQYEKLAEQFFQYSDFLYLGRGVNFPLAMEGALKLKEISYIHAEGYPGGEMKHGPISLIDENMPIVALMPVGPRYEKMLSTASEVKARGGTIIAVATENDNSIATVADHTIQLPSTAHELNPILSAIPMQLLAYYIAIRRGCDIDQPRNLAKSVTVE